MEAPHGAPPDPGQAERLHKFAHDIRNRLAGLHQVLQHLRGTPGEAEKEELITFGEQQFFKALREVEAMLDDLGVDRDLRTTEQRRMELGPVVHAGITRLSHRFGRKEQRVDATIAAGVHVLMDPHHAEQLVDALLSNASKFSAEGVRIHVTLGTLEGKAVLTVHDEGVGLTEADLEQLFVRYAWLESRTTGGEAQGRGSLGRMRRCARLYRGELGATSPGRGLGSTFTLTLPLA